MKKTHSITAAGVSLAGLAELAFKFEIGTHQYHVTQLDQTPTGWRGQTNDPAVSVVVTETTDHLCIELCAPPVKGENVAYFCGSTVGASHVHAFIPDANLGIFPAGVDRTFTVTNAAAIPKRLGLPEELWMIAPQPHVFVLGDRTGRGFSLSIPECLPVDATQLVLQARQFQLSFNYYVSATDAGRLPRVYVDLAVVSRPDALDRHLQQARQLGLVTENKPQPRWWHNPLYCTWGDQCWWLNHGGVPKTHSLTPERILGWADRIRSFYDGEVNFIIDDGYFVGFGDYRLNAHLYPSAAKFRELIAALKARRFRVILWYTPFWLHMAAPEGTDHPEWVLHRPDGKVPEDSGNWKGLYHYDWSHPAVREHHRKILHFLLKELDADGMKVDMTYANPPSREVVPHDPAWAAGNQVCWKVLQLIHAEATRLKPDVFMTFNGVESYFQPYVSAVRLNDLFNTTNAAAWYDRAELVARLMPGVAIDVDGWPSAPAKLREYPFVASVFGAPVTYYVEATEIGDVKFGATEINRLASVWHTYDNAPLEPGQRIAIDVDHDVFERRDAGGALRAKSIARRAFITYGPTIRLTANADVAVAVPLEDGRTVSQAVRVNRDGTRSPVPVHAEPGRALLFVEDAAKGIRYYELQ